MRVETAVVVPMRDSSETIERLLRSLLTQDAEASWELVVVDNGSSDDSVERANQVLADSPHPRSLERVRVVEFGHPQGHASPRNHGAQISDSDKLAFCDADDWVDQGWLTAVSAAVDTHPLVNSNQIAAHEDPGDLTETKSHDSPTLPVKFGFAVAHTGGLGCTRSLFTDLNGFDEYFDSGGADADFSIRAATVCDVRPIAESGAVYFVGPRGSARGALRQGYRYGRSQVRLFERHQMAHDEPQVGPMATLMGAARLLKRLPRVRDARWRLHASRQLGILTARAVWSLRLGVRYF